MTRLLTPALILALACSAVATTITVDDSGGADYTTIQPAINASVSGDTVLVYEGTYTGAGNRDLSFSGRNIVLVSEGENPAAAIIDCGGAARAFEFGSGEDTTAVICGFTIMNAHSADYGGAVYIYSGAAPTIQGCVFETNTANYGGAIDCHGSSPIIRECLFTGNTAAFYAGAIQLWDSNARVAGCSFMSNSAASGGDMFCHAEHPVVIDCTFTGSSVSSEGGSLYLDATYVSLAGCVFNACWANAYGGAISIWYGQPDIVGCQFIGCEAVNLGGAIDCRGSSAWVDDCLFLGCNASGGTAILCANASPEITWCTVIGGTGGSAIRCHNFAEPTIHHVTIASAPSGVHCDYSAAPSISNTVVAFCTESAAFSCDGSSTPLITQCISYGNAGSDSLCGDHHDNLFVDPLFCGMGYDDVTNCANSPCLPANNTWGGYVGAHEGGCDACGSPVTATSWGAIKALYR